MSDVAGVTTVPPGPTGPVTPAPAAALGGTSVGDRIYHVVTGAFTWVVPALLLLIVVEIGAGAWPALRTFGVSFLTSSDWDAVRGHFGAAPMIYGTVVSSILALLIATPLALGVAVFLSEMAPVWLRQPLSFAVDLLAAIPSVIYGLWGIFVLVPFLRQTVMPFLAQTLGLGRTPLFAGPAYGTSMLAAGVILSIMVLPYICVVSREVLMTVPRAQREAALALGATRWETIRDAVVPFARSGIIGGVMLGLARALGETMAVTMLIGNRHEVAVSLFAPGYTLASVIANEFTEASSPLQTSALMACGAVLFAVTITVNAIARWLVWRVAREARA